jgi:hypothetical protein
MKIRDPGWKNSDPGYGMEKTRIRNTAYVRACPHIPPSLHLFIPHILPFITLDPVFSSSFHPLPISLFFPLSLSGSCFPSPPPTLSFCFFPRISSYFASVVEPEPELFALAEPEP